MVDITKCSEDFLLTVRYVHITVAAEVYCKEQDTEKCLVCVKKLVQTLVYMGYAIICTLYTYAWSAIM